MRRIDLDMTVGEWYGHVSADPTLKYLTPEQFRSGARPVKISGRTRLLLEAYYMKTPMKDFCRMTTGDFANPKGIGDRALREITKALSCYGLRFAMTQAEVDRYIAAYASEGSVEAEDGANDKIDWERRRWEAAQMFLTRTFDLSYEGAITMADEFIGEYKKSL